MKKTNERKEKKLTSKEIEEKTNEIKKRYPCYECKHLIYSHIITTELNLRPTLQCNKIHSTNAVPDICNFFKQNKNKRLTFNLPPEDSLDVPPEPPKLPINPKPKRSLFRGREPKKKENDITDCNTLECKHNKNKKCNYPNGLNNCGL